MGGPIVLRVDGATQHPRIRYEVIFRLNRPYSRWPRDPDDLSGPPPLPAVARDALGNYALANLEYDTNHSIFNFDRLGGRDYDNCFFGNVTTDQPDTLRVLDTIPEGLPTTVRLRPLTPKPDGKPAYAHAYVRHPPVIRTRVKPFADGTYLEVTSPGALKALKRIGCSATALS